MSSFESIWEEMRRHNMPLPTEKTRIAIPNAGVVLREMMSHFLSQEGRQPEWLPEYEEVAKWLTDNRGRGLFLFGNCGRGKTLLVRYVLPAILLQHYRKVVTVYDIQTMNERIDEVLRKHIISLDDIGTEEVINSFGNKRQAFSEIMDAVEKQGKLIMVSSNLSQNALRTRYGDRVLDRIVATTERIAFNGESLRQ